MPNQTAEPAAPSGVVLLFRAGMRPGASAVRALETGNAFVITHETRDGLELQVNGLTFELTGLDGGPPQTVPTARYRFGLENEDAGMLEAVALAPGSHLAAGVAMMPVVRSQLLVAIELARLPGLSAVAWAPANSRMAVDYFTSAVSDWLAGGMFPARGLVAVAPAFAGGLQSEGLAFFTGQELRLEPELAEDTAVAMTIADSLIDQLIRYGRLDQPLQVTGPDDAILLLEPSANRAFVRARAAG